MVNYTSIRYGKMRLVGRFKTDREDLRVRDRCIVRTDRGKEVGEVLTALQPIPEAVPPESLWDVVRRAEGPDLQQLQRLETEAIPRATQIFKDAPYMLDIRVAPLVGATIMTDAAWNRISAEDRPKLISAAAAMEQQVNAAAPGLDSKSIAAMTSAGLQVIKLDAKSLAEFRGAAEKLGATQRGGMVPADVFDLAARERDAYRKANPAK